MCASMSWQQKKSITVFVQETNQHNATVFRYEKNIIFLTSDPLQSSDEEKLLKLVQKVIEDFDKLPDK